MSTFGVIKSIRDEMRTIRIAQDLESEAIGDILHRLDAIADCLRVVLKLTKHLHGRKPRRK